MAVVPGADHLLAEPGAVTAVAELARDWYRAQFSKAASTPSYDS
jgi:putative phosphoribosyl transferase